MTYVLVVVFAVLLARGSEAKVSRRQAWPRMLLTVGLMFAPQLGVGVFALLLALGHIGTSVQLDSVNRPHPPLRLRRQDTPRLLLGPR
jgi:hypothetical protein